MKNFSANNLKKFSIKIEYKRIPVKLHLDIIFKTNKLYITVKDLYSKQTRSLLVRDKDEVMGILYEFDDLELGAWPRHLEDYVYYLDGAVFDLMLENKENEFRFSSYNYKEGETKEADIEFKTDELSEFVLDLYRSLFKEFKW